MKKNCFEFKRLILLDENIQKIEVFFTSTNAKISIDTLYSVPFTEYKNFTYTLLLSTLFKEYLKNEGWCSSFTESTMIDGNDDIYPYFSIFEYIKYNEVDWGLFDTTTIKSYDPF